MMARRRIAENKPMKYPRLTALLILAGALLSAAAHASDAQTDWNARNTSIGVLRRAGQLDRATVEAQQALQIAEQNAGFDVAQSLDTLAALYLAQGELDKAVPLYQRAQAVLRKELGPPHRRTTLSEAVLSFARDASKRASAVGPDHPDVLRKLGFVAGVYSLDGDHAKAEPLFLRALKIQETALGPNDPSVAMTLNYLAEVYRATSRGTQADEADRRVEEILARWRARGRP